MTAIARAHTPGDLHLLCLLGDIFSDAWIAKSFDGNGRHQRPRGISSP